MVVLGEELQRQDSTRKSVFLLDLAEPGQYEEVCLVSRLGSQDSMRTSDFLLELVRQDSTRKSILLLDLVEPGQYEEACLLGGGKQR